MVSTLAVLHIIVCVLLILLIMIQDPKGGGSSIFSGGSNSIIGSSGGADFVTKLTRGVAVVFGVLCIALTIATKPSKTGVFSNSPGIEQKVEVPAAGANAPVGPNGTTAPPTEAPKETAPAAPADKK